MSQFPNASRFRGRNAIVTGASRGIGAALSQRLAAEGANLLLVARTLAEPGRLAGTLRETQEICRRYGNWVEVLAADLSDPASRARIVPAALDHFDGRVDILVNNAAAAIYALNLDYPLRRRHLSFEVNFHAPFDLMQDVLPGMVERGEGWIVNVSSGSAHLVTGPPRFDVEPTARVIGVYGASKAALNRITNAFAVEFHGRGIRINTIEPRAAVMSEGAEILVGDSVREDQIESMEGMVEAIAALCACEPDRTGQILESLQLLEELRATIMSLDASRPHKETQSGRR
ncbi:MAG: SDR family NAD(P)-dependent oxidoreductase [Candidatus Binatia bacterium]